MKSKSNIIPTILVGLTIVLSAIVIPIDVLGVEEDDGWVEGDYEGSSEEQEEQAEEDWEDTGRPGEIEDDDDNENDDNVNDRDDKLIECEDGSLVETEELCAQSEALIQCSDGSSAATLDECLPEPVICPDGGEPLPDGSCPPVICPDGGEPLPDGSCPPPPPIKCGKGTHLENGECIRNKDSGGSSSSGSSSSSSSSAIATATVIGTEVSNCRLDGSSDGIQQKFNSIKYQACGFYPNGHLAYSDGFITGCTQVGNTQVICQSLVDSSILNTKIQPTQTAQTIQPSSVTNTSNN
jgi:hypothetical protein